MPGPLSPNCASWLKIPLRQLCPWHQRQLNRVWALFLTSCSPYRHATNIFQSAYISGHVLSAFCLYHLIQSLPQLLKVGAINICILQARGSRHLGWKELVRTTQLGRGGAGVETESTSRLHSPTHRAVPPLQSLFKYVFIRWPGLSCSMQGLLVVACKMQCPGQGSTPCTGTQCRAQSLSHWTPREVPQLTF